MSYTEGPWQTMPEELERPYIRIRGTVPGGKYKIANVLGTCTSGEVYDKPDEVRANAHLIAAAPELLEALKLAHEHMKLHIPDYRSDKWNVHATVKAAIAKARGES